MWFVDDKKWFEWFFGLRNLEKSLDSSLSESSWKISSDAGYNAKKIMLSRTTHRSRFKDFIMMLYEDNLLAWWCLFENS